MLEKGSESGSVLNPDEQLRHAKYGPPCNWKGMMMRDIDGTSVVEKRQRPKIHVTTLLQADQPNNGHVSCG